MPIYEYECAHCRYYLEVMQRIADAPLKRCPSCGRNTLKKLMSAPAFRLKGSGWYETDFKSEQERKRNLVASETDEKKTETKAEAPPAAAAGESKAPPANDAAAQAKPKPVEAQVPGGAKSSAKAAPKAPATRPRRTGKSATRRRRR
jgi:putative FmdB family regulatory protein